ncbi:uncharacterized protein LOC115273099 [Suricata suricatta]|uniref:uncharacterized protein LOC115273099 n=1 Tax=Suricata suricatta TaxID=37032 RepID=UPI001155AA73|nr:uncharacterized protein LOC115273099 [Suricata suricatta]
MAKGCDSHHGCSGFKSSSGPCLPLSAPCFPKLGDWGGRGLRPSAGVKHLVGSKCCVNRAETQSPTAAKVPRQQESTSCHPRQGPQEPKTEQHQGRMWMPPGTPGEKMGLQDLPKEERDGGDTASPAVRRPGLLGEARGGKTEAQRGKGQDVAEAELHTRPAGVLGPLRTGDTAGKSSDPGACLGSQHVSGRDRQETRHMIWAPTPGPS